MHIARGTNRARTATGAVLAVGILTLVANYVTGTAACGVDNSGCARAGVMRPWRGRVFTAAGAPVSRAAVRFYFDSNRTPSEQTGRPLSVVTDPEGRYCLRWPTEATTAPVTVSSGTPGERLVLVSPDATATPGASYLIGSAGQASLTLTNRGGRPASDATGACVTRSPPWYRVENLKNNSRDRLLATGRSPACS